MEYLREIRESDIIKGAHLYHTKNGMYYEEIEIIDFLYDINNERKPLGIVFQYLTGDLTGTSGRCFKFNLKQKH